MTGKEILTVRRKGKRFNGRYFTAYILKAEKNGVAVPTPKKLGSAVQRNRIRRRIREAYRIAIKDSKQKLNIVFYPKFAVIQVNFEDIGASVKSALGQA